ncbi:MAG: 2-oxoglutarate and iron-dependent oxygenase domain-containing protein [bacterium]|nr:2-oxoglutarate and iron-dependent oxygenase domain-containing protein [bacterium]
MLAQAKNILYGYGRSLECVEAEMLREIPRIESLDASLKNAKILELAFREIGFVDVRNEEIYKMMPSKYGVIKKVLDLPEGVKRKYQRKKKGHQRGWTPPYTEEAFFCRRKGPDDEDIADAKENWFIGPELPPDHYLIRQFPVLYPPNIWPVEVPEFKPAMLELYNALCAEGKNFLKLVALSIGKLENYFEEMIHDGPTVMRPLRYPRITEAEIGTVVWGCSHTDINLVTILPASTRPGLYILPRGGNIERKEDWVPGIAPPGYYRAQVGDMLEHLTSGYYLSADHKVCPPENESAEERISVAHFIHPRSDVLLAPQLDTPQRKLYAPITAGDFLLKRLREIGILA